MKRLMPHAKPKPKNLIYARNGLLDMTRKRVRPQPQVEEIVLWLD